MYVYRVLSFVLGTLLAFSDKKKIRSVPVLRISASSDRTSSKQHRIMEIGMRSVHERGVAGVALGRLCGLPQMYTWPGKFMVCSYGFNI